MANTMELIASSTVGAGGVASITFSSIPQTYSDLRMYASLRVTDNGEGSNPPISRCEMTFNNSLNYTNILLYGLPNQSPTINTASGTGTPSSRNFYSGAATSALATANTFSSVEYYISNYTSSAFKAYGIDNVVQTFSVNGELDFLAGIWNNNAAITSIKLNPYNLGNFAQYSTIYLYGISKS